MCRGFLRESRRWVGFKGGGDLRAAEWQERLSLASNIYSIKGCFGTSLTSGVNISLPGDISPFQISFPAALVAELSEIPVHGVLR